MKKKLLSIVLVIIMAMSCLTACGGGKNALSGDKNVIQIKYWLAGLGEQWLKDVIKGFESAYPEYRVVYETSSSQEAILTSLGKEDIDETDLYLCVKNYNLDGDLVPLDDILSSTVEGESKTIGEKFDENYLKLEKASDGHYYNLTYGGGIVGIYYNKTMFEEVGIKQEPRTTDELVLVCDTLYTNGQKAFCHFKPAGYWEDCMGDVFFTQYDGLDYVLNTFYACKDEEGKSPSLDVFTKEDGRYEAIKALSKIVTPEYTMVGSNTYDHTTVQTMWYQRKAAMMVTGSWLTSEMAGIETKDEYALMRTPVISSITDKLTTVKDEMLLRQLVSAIDSVTDGEKKESEYKQGEDFIIGGTTVSADDWNYVKVARNTMAINATGNSAFIPKYSSQIEGAKLFLKYLYSDEGYKIYADTLQQTLPLTLDQGELDDSDWMEINKGQAHIFETSDQFISMYNAGKHKIFSEGGAKWKSLATTYVDKFSSSSQGDRMTAEDAWKDTVQYAIDNYETSWLANIKK